MFSFVITLQVFFPHITLQTPERYEPYCRVAMTPASFKTFAATVGRFFLSGPTVSEMLRP